MTYSRRVKTSVRFSVEDLALLEKLREALGFTNRSDALRLAIREAVENHRVFKLVLEQAPDPARRLKSKKP